MAKRGLGKGLGAFFGDDAEQTVVNEEKAQEKKETSNGMLNGKSNGNKSTAGKVENDKVTEKIVEKVVEKIVEKPVEQKLKVSAIEPNSSQPRKNFDEESLNELAESIKKFGVLQPLLVQKKMIIMKLLPGNAGGELRKWRVLPRCRLLSVSMTDSRQWKLR